MGRPTVARWNSRSVLVADAFSAVTRAIRDDGEADLTLKRMQQAWCSE
jgi:hypothetical protein